MYLTSPANLGEPEPSQVRPGQTLPYREALEETERRQREEYERDCQGIRVLETLERVALSPLERVRRAEQVLKLVPDVFRLKRILAERVRSGRMPPAQASAVMAGNLRRLGFPAGYALLNEPHELARARCALSKARWEFMAWQRTGRIPRERRLLHGRLGEPPAPRGCRRNPIDARAAAIIAAAQNQSQAIDVRGRELVRAICQTYFPSEGGKVSGVQFSEFQRDGRGQIARDAQGNAIRLDGLETQSEGAGAETRGLIRVGRSFVENTNDHFFARRVLQVGHELRHIDQWRAGMVGPAKKAEREFLAHFWVSTTPELPGTGCMPHATRVNVIDAALGNFNCLTAPDRARYAQQQATLLRLRLQEQRASGRAATQPPAACVRSH
jgi:hypothetical protein